MINSVGKYSGLPKDYYSLVAKAVAALAPNTAKTRGDLYAHVRRMLGDQLRLANLPTPKFDICAEQSALEKAIARVEAEIVGTNISQGNFSWIESVERGSATDRVGSSRRTWTTLRAGMIAAGIAILLCGVGVYTYIARNGVDNETSRTDIAVAQDILCPDMRVTHDAFGPEVTDLSSAIRAEAGPNVRPAEWSEIKACYERFGLSYFHKLGIGKGDPNNRVLVVVNGNRYFQAPSRAYFVAFFGGTLPPNWLGHDQVGGNQISLGSWSLRLPALYVVCDTANGKCPAIRTVALPPLFVSPPSGSWFGFGMNHSALLAVALFVMVVCMIHYSRKRPHQPASLTQQAGHLGDTDLEKELPVPSNKAVSILKSILLGLGRILLKGLAFGACFAALIVFVVTGGLGHGGPWAQGLWRGLWSMEFISGFVAMWPVCTLPGLILGPIFWAVIFSTSSSQFGGNVTDQSDPTQSEAYWRGREQEIRERHERPHL
jgi:hypothetical protein